MATGKSKQSLEHLSGRPCVCVFGVLSVSELQAAVMRDGRARSEVCACFLPVPAQRLLTAGHFGGQRALYRARYRALGTQTFLLHRVYCSAFVLRAYVTCVCVCVCVVVVLRSVVTRSRTRAFNRAGEQLSAGSCHTNMLFCVSLQKRLLLPPGRC